MNLFPTSKRKTLKKDNINKISASPTSYAKKNFIGLFSENYTTKRNKNCKSMTKSKIGKGIINSNTNKLTKTSLNGHFNKLFLNYYFQKDFTYTPCDFKATQRDNNKNKDKEQINKNKSKLEYCDNSTLTSEQNYKELIKAKEKEISQLKNEILITQKQLNDVNKQITIASIKNDKLLFDPYIDKTCMLSNNRTDIFDEYRVSIPYRLNVTENNSCYQRSSRSLQVKKNIKNNQLSLSKNSIKINKVIDFNVNESLYLLQKRTQVLLNTVFSKNANAVKKKK